MASASATSLEEGPAPTNNNKLMANGNNGRAGHVAEEVRTVHIAVEPPDGGYGWIVVLASFLCNVTVDGIAYTFGLFLPDLVTSFNSTKSAITWAGSLLSGFYLSAGPVVSALTNRYGCRKYPQISRRATTNVDTDSDFVVNGPSSMAGRIQCKGGQQVCIAGSLLACVSLCLSTTVNSVPLLLIFYGVFAGTGFSLIYLPAIISVNQYFSQKRATATGIAVCGSGLGAFVFAPLVQYLLQYYAWRGALLILAGLVLNCCVFGALMRPLEIWTVAEKPLMQRIWEEKTGLMRQDSIGQSQFFLVQHPDGTVERRLKAGVNTEPGVHSTLFLDQWGKSSTEAPPALTLSPIEESDPMKSGPQANGVNPQVSNHAIHNIAKRKGLIASHSAARLTMSTTTVQPDIRRNSSTPKFAMGASRGSIQHRPLAPIIGSGHHTAGMAGSNTNTTHETNYLLAPPPLDCGLNPQMRKSIRDLARPMYRKDIFYSGSIRNLPEFRQSSGDVRSYIASVLTLPGENPSKTTNAACGCLPPAMQDTLGDIFDPVLLKNPAFVIICIANLIGMMGFNIPFVFIADAAVTIANVDKNAASMLVSCIGITNMFGRLIFGRLSDSPRVNSLTVNNITLVISGFAVTITPLSLQLGGYSACMVVCAVFGLMVAAYILLTSIILVELFGLERLTNAFGLLCLVRGLACILGTPFAGVLFDLTGSYQCPFIISGIMLAISGGISATIPYVNNPHKIVPPPPEDFMSPLEEIPEEESFTEDDYSPRHERRIRDLEDSLAEDERASLMEEDEDDLPMTINCDPRIDSDDETQKDETIDEKESEDRVESFVRAEEGRG